MNRAPYGTFGAAVAEVGVLDLLKVSLSVYVYIDIDIGLTGFVFLSFRSLLLVSWDSFSWSMNNFDTNTF